MPRGRKPRLDLVQKHVYLPQVLVTQVELLLPLDIIKGVPQYGTWSGLIEGLLRDWLIKKMEEERLKNANKLD